jgi:hypothetical protein
LSSFTTPSAAARRCRCTACHTGALDSTGGAFVMIRTMEKDGGGDNWIGYRLHFCLHRGATCSNRIYTTKALLKIDLLLYNQVGRIRRPLALYSPNKTIKPITSSCLSHLFFNTQSTRSPFLHWTTAI